MLKRKWAALLAGSSLCLCVGYWAVTGNTLWQGLRETQRGTYTVHWMEAGQWQPLGGDLQMLRDTRRLTGIAWQDAAGSVQVRAKVGGVEWVSEPLAEGDSCLLPADGALQDVEVRILSAEGTPPDRSWTVALSAEPNP